MNQPWIFGCTTRKFKESSPQKTNVTIPKGRKLDRHRKTQKFSGGELVQRRGGCIICKILRRWEALKMKKWTSPPSYRGKVLVQVQCRFGVNVAVVKEVPSLKLTNRHGKSTILMVFTRKDGDFHGWTVSFREGKFQYLKGQQKRSDFSRCASYFAVRCFKLVDCSRFGGDSCDCLGALNDFKTKFMSPANGVTLR